MGLRNWLFGEPENDPIILLSEITLRHAAKLEVLRSVANENAMLCDVYHDEISKMLDDLKTRIERLESSDAVFESIPDLRARITESEKYLHSHIGLESRRFDATEG